MSNLLMNKKPSVEELLNIKNYKYKFNIGALLRNKPFLCILLNWPDGEFERMVFRLGGSDDYLSFPQSRSMLTDNSLLEIAENFDKNIFTVNECYINAKNIYLQTDCSRIHYYADDMPPYLNIDGEAALVFLAGLSRYFWPFSEYIRLKDFNELQLYEYLSVYPSAINFRRVRVAASEFFANRQIPKLGKGKRSIEKRLEKSNRDYALYNLIRSEKSKGKTLTAIFEELDQYVNEDFQLNKDYAEAFRKAYDRAKKNIEIPVPEKKANFMYSDATIFINGKESKIYFMEMCPSD